MAVKVGTLNFEGIDFSESKRLAYWVADLIEQGAIGYTLITPRKE